MRRLSYKSPSALMLGIALAGALVASLAVLSVVMAQTPASPLTAPVTTMSNDGRTATDGSRTLTVSKVRDVDPAGEILSIEGTGYNVEKGLYIAFCVIPAKDQVPTPCGGGIDMSGTSGSAAWISSNVPSYGEGLAKPYGPGGSFSLNLAVAPRINDSIDCRTTPCAIVSRNDHTRTSDRSQDIFVPIGFKGGLVAAVSGESGGTGAGTTAPQSAVEESEESSSTDSGLIIAIGAIAVAGILGTVAYSRLRQKGAK